MIERLIDRKKNPKLGFTITIRTLDMNFPKSIEEVEAVLIEHVVGCKDCLAATLFFEEDLAQTGCDGYKSKLAEIKAGLVSLTFGTHINEDVLQKYCFNGLSQNCSRRVEEHIRDCAVCAETFNHRLEFFSLVKDDLTLSRHQHASIGLAGVVAVHSPEGHVSVRSRINS